MARVPIALDVHPQLGHGHQTGVSSPTYDRGYSKSYPQLSKYGDPPGHCENTTVHGQAGAGADWRAQAGAGLQLEYLLAEAQLPGSPFCRGRPWKHSAS